MLEDIEKPEELEILLEFLLSHKKEYIANFLREKGLYSSGTKSTLKERLVNYIDHDEISIENLVDLLDEIEGWGNQHIYIYTGPNSLLELWKDAKWVKRHLTKKKLEGLLNKKLPLILPDSPQLSSIKYSDEQLRIIWVEKRKWEDRIPDKDEVRDNLIMKAYLPRISRGLIVFEWNLISNQALFMIQRLPRGSNYEATFDEYIEKMKRIIDISHFDIVKLRPAIKRIESSDETRRRQINFETTRGGNINFKSSTRDDDYQDDPTLSNARSALGNRVSGSLGNFYWLPCSNLERAIHTHIYGRFNRAGFFGECREEEVRYVLSRIRNYC